MKTTLIYFVGLLLGLVSCSSEGDDPTIPKPDTPIAIDMVYIQRGNFLRGSPALEPDRKIDETQHQVQITQHFWISQYPVTNAQYAIFLNTLGVDNSGVHPDSKHPAQVLIAPSSGTEDWGLHYNTTSERWTPVAGKEQHPVIYVSWFGADAFAYWMNGSLPTEAQWEYAARAGNTTPFGLGDGRKLLGYRANFDGKQPYDLDHNPPGAYQDDGGLFRNETTPVDSYAPNAWGLYDMYGNVNEWCSDRLGKYPTGMVGDPTGPTGGDCRIFRGGSWKNPAEYCRSAFRGYTFPNTMDNRTGFRIVLY